MMKRKSRADVHLHAKVHHRTMNSLIYELEKLQHLPCTLHELQQYFDDLHC